MTIQEINELTVEQTEPILIERLNLEEGTEPTVEQLEAELVLYKEELIAIEEARLAEIARIEDLKSRISAMSDSGLIQMVGGMSNPAAYFRDEILGNPDHAQAESKLSSLETLYAEALSNASVVSWADSRQVEYAKIDRMLMEAIAEQQVGRPEKMQEYLALREQIKQQYPKP